MFRVLISPGKAGSDDFLLQLMDGGGALLPVRAATLVLTEAGSGAGLLERQASLESDGYWHACSLAAGICASRPIPCSVKSCWRTISTCRSNKEPDFFRRCAA